MGFYFFQAEEIAGVKGLRVLKVETEVTAVLWSCRTIKAVALKKNFSSTCYNPYVSVIDDEQLHSVRLALQPRDFASSIELKVTVSMEVEIYFYKI